VIIAAYRSPEYYANQFAEDNDAGVLVGRFCSGQSQITAVACYVELNSPKDSFWFL